MSERPELPDDAPQARPQTIHPRALAFLGDAAFEVKVRELAVAQGFNHSDDLHKFTTARVNASAQAALLHHLKASLTESELDIIRQGRNMAVGSTRKSDQATYRQATGFETLIGYWRLNDPARFSALWDGVMRPYLLSEQPLSPKE